MLSPRLAGTMDLHNLASRTAAERFRGEQDEPMERKEVIDPFAQQTQNTHFEAVNASFGQQQQGMPPHQAIHSRGFMRLPMAQHPQPYPDLLPGTTVLFPGQHRRVSSMHNLGADPDSGPVPKMRNFSDYSHAYDPYAEQFLYQQAHAHAQHPIANDGFSHVQGPKRKKGTKRKGFAPNTPDSVIQWEDLGIDDHTASIVFSILPREKVNQLLNDGAGSLMCSLSSHISAEQQDALKVVKQRLRAEKKSRREKQRRVHVNNSLNLLASKINIKPEDQDMNSILLSAIRHIEGQEKELSTLRKMLSEMPNSQ